MTVAPTTASATFCATLVDQWVGEGLTQAFVAPGSRSTPLALAVVRHPAVDVALFHDERGAAFAALGHGQATGRPSVVLSTSGTAGSHFYAAIIEADASAVPMIVCTADRPPELWGRGAPQTIDQTELFGSTVRCFFEPGPPDDSDPSSWRAIARDAWNAAIGHPAPGAPGPVHCNLSFRDPLTGLPGALPEPLGHAVPQPATSLGEATLDDLGGRLRGRRGVIVAGRNESSQQDVLELARRLGWPLLADHRSNCRDETCEVVVDRFDALLRHASFADRYRPEVVLRVGEPLSSKALSQWLARCGADIIATRPHGRNIDPETIATTQVDEAGLLTALVARIDVGDAVAPDWLEAWTTGDRQAQAAIDDVLARAESPNEIEIARHVVAAVPEAGALVVSSSMPVRDVEWFADSRRSIDVYSNRGANGIDGVIATSIGVALTGTPTTCLLGDIAFLHDSSSLVALRDRDIDLTIIVVDNDGGGIFSFLPQNDLLDTNQYEFLFGTPHGTDLAALCEAHGIRCDSWPAPGGFDGSGVRVVIAPSERSRNHALHNAIEIAVGDLLAELFHD